MDASAPPAAPPPPPPPPPPPEPQDLARDAPRTREGSSNGRSPERSAQWGQPPPAAANQSPAQPRAHQSPLKRQPPLATQRSRSHDASVGGGSPPRRSASGSSPPRHAGSSPPRHSLPSRPPALQPNHSGSSSHGGGAGPPPGIGPRPSASVTSPAGRPASGTAPPHPAPPQPTKPAPHPSPSRAKAAAGSAPKAAPRAKSAPAKTGAADSAAGKPAGKKTKAPTEPEDAGVTDEIKRKLLGKVREYIEGLGGKLEGEWTVEMKQRKSGNTAGASDAYYRSPSGKRFRSRREIATALGLEERTEGRTAGPSKGAAAAESPDKMHVRARELVAQADLAVPLRVDGDVTVVSLGAVKPQMPFFTRDRVYPVGYSAEWVDGSSGSVITSSILLAAEDAMAPTFQVSIRRGGASAPSVVLATSRDSPDAVWRDVDALARAAVSMDKEGGASDGGKDDPIEAARRRLRDAPDLAAALRDVQAPPLRWGALLYGMADVRTLKLLEALDDVPACKGYLFAEARGGWTREAEGLADSLRAWDDAARTGSLLPPTVLSKPTLKRKAEVNSEDPSAPAKRARALAAVAFKDNSLATQPLTKQDLKVQDDIAKLMDKVLTKVEKNLETQATKEAKKHEKAEHTKILKGLPIDQLIAAPERQIKSLTEDSELPNPTSSPPAGTVLASSLPPHLQSSVLQVWMFSRQFSSLLGIKQLPQYAAVEASLGRVAAVDAPSIIDDNRGGGVAEQLIIALLRLVVGEVYDVSVRQYVEKAGDVEAQVLDVAGGCPVIDHDTWQHAAAALIAGVAMGQYLKQMDCLATAYQPLAHWEGLQGALDPTLWLSFLTGAFVNTPAMRPELAFLPPAAPAAAPMALLHRQAAAATVRAFLLCADGDQAFDDLAVARSAVHCAVDDVTDAINSSQARAEQQAKVEALVNALLGKMTRTHRALVSHAGDELSVAGRSGRPVDLHSIAVAVDERLYACTGDAVSAAAEDVRGLCAAMRAAAKRRLIPLDAHFDKGEAIADALEDTLDEVLSHVAGTEADAKDDADAVKAGGAHGRSPLDTLLAVEVFDVEEQHLSESAEEQLARCSSSHSASASRPATLQELFQLEKLAALLARPPSPDWKPSAHQQAALLYCLLVFALESNKFRDALKALHARRDSLSAARQEIKKNIKQADKQAKEDAKAAASNAPPAPSTRAAPSVAEKKAEGLQQVQKIDRQLAELALEITPHLGSDRHHNNYWCLPSSALVDGEARHADWVVVCQQRDPQAAASTSSAAVDADDAAKGLIFHDGWRADEDTSRLAPAEGRWVIYATPAELDALEGWLHSDGVREGPLKARLRCVRAVIAMKEGGEPPAAAPGPHAPSDAQAPGPTPEPAAPQPDGVGGSEAARALALELLRTLQALPEEALLSVRGGEARRRALRHFLVRKAGLPESAAEADCDLDEASPAAAGDCALAPRDLMAALLLIEGMVALPYFKPFWRLWSLPPPDPVRTHTLSAVWFRLKAFQQAVRDNRTAAARKELAAYARKAASQPTRRAPERAAPSAVKPEPAQPAPAPPKPRVRTRASEDDDGAHRTRQRRAVNYAEDDGEDDAEDDAKDDADDDDFDAVMEDPGSPAAPRGSAGGSRAARAREREVRRGDDRASRLRSRASRRVVVDSDDGSDSDESPDELDLRAAKELDKQLNARVTRQRAR